METTPLTIEVPANVAEALADLDGPLAADETAFESILRWSIHKVQDDLADEAEGSETPDGEELRRLAVRLQVLADACEAVKPMPLNPTPRTRRCPENG